jgi:hypothetical protein
MSPRSPWSTGSRPILDCRYILTYNNATTIILDLRQSNPPFNEFLEAQKEVAGQPIESFLIMPGLRPLTPVQRIPRYSMILEGLYKETKIGTLETAIGNTVKTLVGINSSQKQLQMRERQAQLIPELNLGQYSNKIDMKALALIEEGSARQRPARDSNAAFDKKEYLKQKLLERQLFLFDRFLFLSTKIKKGYELETVLSVNASKVFDRPTDDQYGASFRIMTYNFYYDFFVENTLEKHKWLLAFATLGRSPSDPQARSSAAPYWPTSTWNEPAPRNRRRNR